MLYLIKDRENNSITAVPRMTIPEANLEGREGRERVRVGAQ
jgi:hypothetical protein